MNLPPGNYVMKLVPGGTGFQAGEGVAALGQDGLTVNWVVSKTAAALVCDTWYCVCAGPGAVGGQGEVLIRWARAG